ncbi:hypothetical protein MSAN_00910700 [Mycena sanguinolenta]|uniref:Uncharacterized protein n=1 Tax=Mycena sanguinolenta TaxID=230812 RepID=A0A8H7D8U9_9AGAR|nr:hypothetical protein MSAN_00910700 [Mycena sanguinolenta]
MLVSINGRACKFDTNCPVPSVCDAARSNLGLPLDQVRIGTPLWDGFFYCNLSLSVALQPPSDVVLGRDWHSPVLLAGRSLYQPAKEISSRHNNLNAASSSNENIALAPTSSGTLDLDYDDLEASLSRTCSGLELLRENFFGTKRSRTRTCVFDADSS